MGSIGDFHLHSTISDGRKTPTEVVDLAYANGVRVMSLTDHDIVDGLAEAFAAAEKYPDLTLVPGIEMSSDIDVPISNEVHVLGHFIDRHDQAFLARLKTMQESRITRARKMVEKLGALGKPVDWARVEHFAGEGSVGRPHIALALVEAGHVSGVNEAFELYLSRGKEAYVSRDKLTPEEAVELIRSAGGLVTLAHPGRELKGEGVLEDLLRRLVPLGLTGLEVYYQDYPPDEVQRLRAVADRHGIIPMGGSDYHGLGNPQQREPGQMDTPLPIESIRRLFALAEERGCLRQARLAYHL
jgi:hypothetical protein